MSKIFTVLILFFTYLKILIEAQSCGVAKLGKGNIIRGRNAIRGQFPWTAALLLLYPRGEYKYFCGGVLIHPKYVISVAHCVRDKGRTVSVLPGEILIILGGFDLNKKFETGREIIAPIRIYLHPSWNSQVQTFDGDLSLYELEQSIQYTNYIQPICLWPSSVDPQVNFGTVVGYGRSENEAKIHENTPKVIQIPIHSQEHCFLREPSLAKLSSNRTFCAGRADGTGVCSGDSGGGLMVKINEVYYLRGIVSSSLIKDFTCDVGNYAIFTNVIKYQEWIFNILRIPLPVAQPPQVIQRIPSKILQTTSRPTQNSLVTQQNFNVECGTMSSAAGLIQGGRFSNRVQFPWIVYMIITFSSYTTNPSGTLVSRRHVVTAGRAVSFYSENTRSYNPISTKRIRLFLGALTINDPNSVLINAATVTLHPNIKDVDETSVNNLAIITLANQVPFNDFIRPICLWTFNNALQYVSSSPFYSVGYGLDESGKPSNNRKYSRVSLVDLQSCEKTFEYYQNVFHETDAFCAKGTTAESPCDFDDMLFVKFNERWFFRGILLLNFHFDNFQTCNYNEPVLFEDMAQHTRWIQSQIS